MSFWLSYTIHGTDSILVQHEKSNCIKQKSDLKGCMQYAVYNTRVIKPTEVGSIRNAITKIRILKVG